MCSLVHSDRSVLLFVCALCQVSVLSSCLEILPLTAALLETEHVVFPREQRLALKRYIRGSSQDSTGGMEGHGGMEAGLGQGRNWIVMQSQGEPQGCLDWMSVQSCLSPDEGAVFMSLWVTLEWHGRLLEAAPFRLVSPHNAACSPRQHCQQLRQQSFIPEGESQHPPQILSRKVS